MLNDDLLNKKLKEMTIERIDITDKVMDGLRDKKSPLKKRIFLIAAMFLMIVSAVFAANWITFYQDDSYAIRTEEKQWYTSFDLEVDEALFAKYTALKNELIETATLEGKDLIGYYKSDDLDYPFIFTSNSVIFYPISKLDDFDQQYDHHWIEVVKEAMPSDYSLSGASANISYSEDYYKAWIDRASQAASDGQLYYEAIDEPSNVRLLKMRYTKLRQGTLYQLNASIVMESSNGTTQSVNRVSEIVTIRGHEGVLTSLDGNYKLLELEYNNNLLILHGNIKSDAKESMMMIMSDIISGLED